MTPMSPGGKCRCRTKNLAVVLAIGLPLAAAYIRRVGVLLGPGWGPGRGPAARRSRRPTRMPRRRRVGTSRRPISTESCTGTLSFSGGCRRGAGGRTNGNLWLDFTPDGKLAWTTLATVGDRPPLAIVERYEYSYQPGPGRPCLTLTERTIDGMATRLL